MTGKKDEIKQKHHHVWADYLKRWSVDGLNVYHTTSRKKIRCESVKGLAMERNFYKLNTLTALDLHLIDRSFKDSSEVLKKAHSSFLAPFILLQGLEKRYLESGHSHAEIDFLLHKIRSNSLEDLHGLREREAAPILKSLANEDLTILHAKATYLAFMEFLGQQFSRTKTIKDRVLLSLGRGTELELQLAESMENAWWVYSHLFGINIGADLFFNRAMYSHTLLLNDTKVPFVTGDQPVINVHPCVSYEVGALAPESLDIYYPISPRIAYVVCESKRFTDGKMAVDESIVQELNKKIARNASIHIFGNSEESLKDLVKDVGYKKVYRQR